MNTGHDGTSVNGFAEAVVVRLFHALLTGEPSHCARSIIRRLATPSNATAFAIPTLIATERFDGNHGQH